jgi:gluconate 2-dehydrogenase gamma chain
MVAISRRTFLAGASLLPLASRLPHAVLADVYAAATPRHFDAHQAAVVEAATARLIPGPTDDPGEGGHPGAREARVVRYIDGMLGALGERPARVFTGGPFSDRNGHPHDDMARFVALDRVEQLAWTRRLAALRERYDAGIAALDDGTGGDFVAATAASRDDVLVANPGDFTTLLMQHSIEGMYANPEYGGNSGLLGWSDISFPGDSQPRGYTAEQVTNGDGPDPLVMTAPVQAALGFIALTAPPET